MYRKKLIKIVGLGGYCACFIASSAKAQFSLVGQLRTRTEYRNGLGTLKPIGNTSAFFSSQRVRLTFNYQSNKVVFQTSVQDVRVWGQDASTISNADGTRLSVHEAWANIILANSKDTAFKKSAIEYLSLKIGRQELVYDDQRLLGNLDWLQQGRRHDAAVLKLVQKGWNVDLGAGFNQNTDAFNYNGTYYTPANIPPYVKDSRGNLVPVPSGLVPLATATGVSSKTGSPSLQTTVSTNGMNQNYKAMQYLYASKKLHSTTLSGLFFVDHFSKYKLDSVKTVAGSDTGYVYGRRYNVAGVNSRITTGAMITSLLDKRKTWSLNAGAYYQTGKDRDGVSLDAYTTTLSLSYTKSKFSYIGGCDYLSGNNAFSTAAVNHRFDPLYGTPHKFWGYMDYFYAGTGSPTGGLSNFYFKSKYTSANKNFSVGLDYHYFDLAQEQKDITGAPINKYLGSELDLVTSYNLNIATTLEWGFSYLPATHSMEYAKGITPGTANLNATWSYLQINIKPTLFSK